MGASENLLGRLQAWSDVFPDAPACRSAGEVLSYAQLWQRAGVLAAGLRRDHGIANGDPVGLVATESVEFLCGLAGIARAGAAFVPLDPEMPARRREQLLRAAGVRLVLAPGAADASGRSTLCLDRFDWRSATREAPERVPAEACQLAYICFTSGSTGEPAGVEVDHHNVAQYANALAARLAPPPGLTFLPLASLATDHAYTAVFGALFTGGCVELLPASVRQDAVALAAATADHRPDYIKAVPGHLLALHRAGAPLLPHRGLILGGEPLRYGQVRELLQADGGCAVFNHYGPTETTIGVCMHNVDPTAPRADDQPVPLGSPLGDNALELQDPDGGPNEEEGEIVIRGPAVARGYRGSNARAGRFSGDGSERSYRTGDLGRINAEGLVEFVGRVDDELKLRGFRINPRETEGIIRMHPDVQDCLVTPVRDENDAPVSLVARVELKPDTVSRKQERERVHHWRSVHEDKYARASAAPRTTGGQTMAGWRNSYDGLAFPAAEMEEWTTGTLQRIRALGARSIYEAGCGAGLLALPLAGHARYTGSDFSSGALALLREQLEEAGHGDVRLHQCEARDVGFLEGERFDLVVLNSVLQHFPGPGYLEDVLKALVSVAAPGGRIFIGDVRDLERLEWFHFSRQLFLSPGSRDIAELLERVAASVAAEHELVVAPEWFRQFAERQGWQARAMPKAGRYRNEMNRFRYDAVLFAGMDPAQDDRFEQVQAPRPGEIKELLAEGPAGLHVTGLCDARAADIARHFRLAQELTGNVAELREQIRREQDAETGMEPQVVEQIADRAGYDATLVLETGERPGQFEAWFVRRGFHATGAQARGPAKQPVARPHTNDPQENERRRRFPTQLRTFLRERLPAHLVPAQVGCVDRLPRLANGKPDRRAGPLPTGDRGDEPVRPRNSVEAWLQNIWQELLGHAPIGVHDDFFEHGGHSLLAVQLLTRATGANGRTLDHEAFLRSPTISGMAALLAGSPKADARPEPGADTGNGAGDRTLSAAERRLWVASVLDPDPAAFNVCYRVDFTRGPDEATLEEALGRLCQRHPALRSTFPAPGRDPVRCVLPAFRPPLQVIDQPRRALDDFIEEELARPHSLESSPPVRCTLIKTAGSGACLLFTVHHLIFDGWSRDVFFRELAAVYRALQAGESQVLPRSVDTAATAVAPADLDADLLWWREHLQGAPRLALPFAGTGGTGAGRVPVQADTLLCRALHRLAHSEDASLFMVLAAAWAITAGALGREDDVVFGTDMAGRDRDSGDQIGFFINPLPLRITVRSGMTVREVVAGTREVVLGAFKRQYVPFDDILRATGVARDAVAAPLFDTKLVLQQGALDPPRLDGQALVPQAHIRGLDMNLLLDLTEAGGALSGWVKFRRQALDQATAGRIASAFVALLEDMVRWPEARVPDLALAISERVLPAATGFRAHAGRRQATVPSSPGVVTDALQ